jgi:cyclopropane-fatty-acyl-phospholipid synthase
VLNEEGYDERFMRMWQYYLNYCEGGFLERVISTAQVVVAKPQHRSSLSRGA